MMNSFHEKYLYGETDRGLGSYFSTECIKINREEITLSEQNNRTLCLKWAMAMPMGISLCLPIALKFLFTDGFPFKLWHQAPSVDYRKLVIIKRDRLYLEI